MGKLRGNYKPISQHGEIKGKLYMGKLRGIVGEIKGKRKYKKSKKKD